MNIHWLWRYSKAVEHVTGGSTSGVLAFVIIYLLSFIGAGILQSEFNKLPEIPATPVAAVNPVTGVLEYAQPAPQVTAPVVSQPSTNLPPQNPTQSA